MIFFKQFTLKQDTRFHSFVCDITSFVQFFLRFTVLTKEKQKQTCFFGFYFFAPHVWGLCAWFQGCPLTPDGNPQPPFPQGPAQHPSFHIPWQENCRNIGCPQNILPKKIGICENKKYLSY